MIFQWVYFCHSLFFLQIAAVSLLLSLSLKRFQVQKLMEWHSLFDCAKTETTNWPHAAKAGGMLIY